MAGTPRKLIIASVILLVALAAVIGWIVAQRGIERDADAQAIAGAVSATFIRARALKVGEASGDVQASSNDARLGGRLVSKAVLRAPYTVDYFVDLNQVGLANARWNSAQRVLVVTVPDVRIAAPNIAVAGMTLEQQGLFVTRAASADLVKRAVTTANRYAVDRAGKPDFYGKAREEGREAVKELIELPLRATGRRDIRVEVRYRSEGMPGRELLDGSTPVADVLAQARSQR